MAPAVTVRVCDSARGAADEQAVRRATARAVANALRSPTFAPSPSRSPVCGRAEGGRTLWLDPDDPYLRHGRTGHTVGTTVGRPLRLHR